MPIYEYRCPACAEISEIMQKVSDSPPTVCPSCNAEGPLEKLVSRTSFQLKGGGWYADLYSSSKKNESSDKKAPAASTDPKPAPAKTETKPSVSGTKPSGSSPGGSSTK